MAKTLGIIFLCWVLLLVSLEIQASVMGRKPASHGQKQRSQAMYGIMEGSLHPQECAPRCSTRCSVTAHKKPCMFFCQKCCAKCLCVPAGTYGNKQSCPCYNNWKTKQGGPKCP